MGVSVGELSSRYPRLYHMAAPGSWNSIQQHGLLSTSALLDLYEYSGVERKAIERRHRPESVVISHPVRGRAVVRDQKPMSDHGLERALLDGLSPEDWYRRLNRMVFFWSTEKRLDTFANAKAYRDTRKLFIVCEAALLLKDVWNSVHLSAMNSGSTRPFAHPRGAGTFQPPATHPFHERLRRRLEPVAEVAVIRSVPNIGECAVEVWESGGGEEDTWILRKEPAAL